MTPEISEKSFKAYVKVQKSGVTNMLDMEKVCALSDLTREEVRAIQAQYEGLSKKYSGVTASGQ